LHTNQQQCAWTELPIPNIHPKLCPYISNGLERIVTIYVGNLSFQATEDDLREVFAEYGEVSRISLPTDRETGRKRGFAFVEMSSDAQEDAAITELDGAEWLGREIRVNKAKPREEGGGGGGNRRNGGFSRE
jgi:RNA recognition motif-containing protein